MRTCLEHNLVTVSQRRRVATAVILNSIPLATNPNGALLLTWLLDTSNFPSRYRLLAPRFTPHLSHLCTHKLASLTVLRIVNQKTEPDASTQIVDSLFFSNGDHVLADVLGDQVNGVAVVHKILTSPFIDQSKRASYLEVTKRVLIELKVIATQAYRRLIEEVGLPVSNFTANYAAGMSQSPGLKKSSSQGSYYGSPTNDQNLASMMAALQMGGQSHMTPQQGSAPSQLQIDPVYGQGGSQGGSMPSSARGPRGATSPGGFSPAAEPFNPFNAGSPVVENHAQRPAQRRNGSAPVLQTPQPTTLSQPPVSMQSMQYNAAPSPSLGQAGSMMGVPVAQAPYAIPPQQQQQVPPHVYQAYMYQMYQQQGQQNGGPGHYQG